jgi:hypothetical protein
VTQATTIPHAPKEGKKWKRKFGQGNEKEERRIERDTEKRDGGIQNRQKRKSTIENRNKEDTKENKK